MREQESNEIKTQGGPATMRGKIQEEKTSTVVVEDVVELFEGVVHQYILASPITRG